MNNNRKYRKVRREEGFGLLDIMISMGVVAGLILLVFTMARLAIAAVNTDSLFSFLHATYTAAYTWERQSGYSDYTIVSYRSVNGRSGTGANPQGGDCTLGAGADPEELVMTLTNIAPTSGRRVANAYGPSFESGIENAMASYDPATRILTVTYAH